MLAAYMGAREVATWKVLSDELIQQPARTNGFCRQLLVASWISCSGCLQELDFAEFVTNLKRFIVNRVRSIFYNYNL